MSLIRIFRFYIFDGCGILHSTICCLVTFFIKTLCHLQVCTLHLLLLGNHPQVPGWQGFWHWRKNSNYQTQLNNCGITWNLKLIFCLDNINDLPIEFLLIAVKCFSIIVLIYINEHVLLATRKPTMGFLIPKIPCSQGDIL